MIRLLPFVVEAIILVFCLIDAIMADETRIRNLPKWAWILLIIIIPLVGGIAWLVAGRPANSVSRTPTASQRPVGRSDWEQPPRQRPKAPRRRPRVPRHAEEVEHRPRAHAQAVGGRPASP